MQTCSNALAPRSHCLFALILGNRVYRYNLYLFFSDALENNFGVSILRNGNDGFDLSELFLQNEIDNIGNFRKFSMAPSKINYDDDTDLLTNNNKTLGFELK